jgi:hypothetical protein
MVRAIPPPLKVKVSIEFAKMNKELFIYNKIYTEVLEALAKVKLPERLISTSCRQHFINRYGYIKIKDRLSTV